MKTFLAIAAIAILVAAGYYVFVMTPTAAPVTETKTPTNTGAEGKININTVCEGALAYMSFSSGAEANAWVEACKRGEHPEAIEQWKQMNGITDDRAI
ncbi:MAG: hypothetical protein WA021_02085 [Minisyncoccia bacterium]